MSDLTCLAFFGWGQRGICYWQHCCLAYWSWEQSQVLSIVTTLYRKTWSCLFSTFSGTNARTLRISAACSSPPSLTTASTFHIRGLISQQSPKCYLLGLSGQFCKLAPCFHLCDLWRDDLNMHCLQPEKLQPKFPHICIKKTTQKFVFSTVHCHWQLFQTSHAFLLQISWV